MISGMGGFDQYASIPFRFGAGERSLDSILGAKTLSKFREKFDNLNDRELFVGLREVLRFLYLAAHSPTSLFFPGNAMLDELWHALVVETAEYRELCHALRPGAFLDHTGIKFRDYAAPVEPARIHEEQTSWLASYVANFGHFDDDAFSVLYQLQEMSERTGSDLARLNAFADLLIAAATPADEKFDFDSFVRQTLLPNAYALDRDPGLVKDGIRALVEGLRNENEEFRLSLSQAEALHSASLAFAFTLMQHLAAVERLEGLPEWQQRNPELWRELSSGRKLCGLATTNLARPGGAGVTAIERDGDFVLNGTAPWVCGLGIFDRILIGFETPKTTVIATLEAPIRSRQDVSATLLSLACLNGAATYQLGFKDFVLPKTDLVSRREKDGTPVRPRPSKFVIPEIGLGAGALEACEALVAQSPHPRHGLARDALPAMKARLEKIRELRDKNEASDTLVTMRDEFNRDAVRLLTLAVGAASLVAGSRPERLQRELLLLDSVIQTPETLRRKFKLATAEKSL